VISSPPIEVIAPPQIAEVAPMLLAAEVVSVGGVEGFSF